MKRSKRSISTAEPSGTNTPVATPTKQQISSVTSPRSLYGMNICNVYKKQSNLIDYLHELHADLQRLDQDLEKTPPGFKDTVQHLVSSKLLDNSDKKVRLLVGCCLVDIFRIYAPDTPYKDGVMLRVFEVMSILIRNLETAINGSEEQSQSIYIIQSLATVKSCVIPVIMAQRGVRGALETAQTLFQALIDSVRPDHSDALLSSCADIMNFCIVEFEGIPEEWIDVLLFPLLPQSKADNPTAYKLVAGTLRSVGPLPVVQSCFGQLASDVLVNPSGGRNTEVTEEIYSLIYELHLVHPPLLFNIIPTITVLLKVDNDEVRAKIVKLLGKLYTSDHYDYTREFDKEFREFASRINDRIPQVRNEMVETIVMLILSRPRLKSFLEELILKKLRDPEEEIRLHTLKKLLDFAQTNITSLSTETYNEICDRVKDKKSEVRKVALIGLSKLYCHHVSSCLHPISQINGRDNSDITEGILDEVLHRLESVPSIVLKSWGYPDYPTKHLILHLLQEYILPKSIKLNSGKNGDDSVVENEADGDDNRKNSLDEVRASALVLLFRSMREEVDKVSFGAILNFKMKIADELHHFLRLKSAKSGNENVGNGGERLSLNSTPVDDSARFAEIRQSLYNITFSLPLLPDKKHTVFDRLITSKDKFILKLVEFCVDASDNITEGLQHKQDLQKRLDSKSPLGEYMGVVYDFAAHFLFDVHVIGALLRALNSYDSKVDSTEIADILTFLSKFSAKSFSRSSSDFASWAKQSIVEKTDKGRQKQMKEKLFNGFVATTIAASRWLINDENRVELTEYLVEAAQNASDPYICLKLGEVLGNLAFIYYGDDKNRASGSVIKLLQTICSKKALNVGNQRILNNLCILSSVFRVPSIAYEKAETVGITARAIHEASVSLKTNIFKFLFDDLFKSEDASAEAKSVGLRIAANLLCCEDDYNRIEGVGEKPLSPFSSPSSSSFSSLNYLVSLSDLIFECISNHGQVFSGVGVSEEEDQQQLLEASAIDALILSRIHDFASLLTVEQWLELAWTLAKSDREIKKHLLQYLTSTIQIHPVHLRFLAFPCLFATDSEFAEAAQKSLIFAIKRLRRTNEEISAKLVAEKDEVQRERLKHFVQYTTPETVLPYVLYLLSYHPDFPSSMRVDNDEDKRKLKDMMKCVQMLIHSLQVTLRQETSNLPFLFKQLNTIMQNYLDREDNENAGVHFITRLTLKILTEQVKTVDNMQVYPNEVIPPEELFVATEVGKPQKLLSLVAMDQGRGGGAVDTELVIEKAINSTHRSKNTLTSPVRSGGASFIKTKASPDYKERKISAKQSKKEGTKKKAPTKALVEEAPTRSLPKRGAKAVTSYAEAEEDESEVERWNENAAKVTRRSLSQERNSFLKIPQRLSSSSNQSRPSTASWKSEVDNEDDDELFGDDLVKSALKPSRLSQSSHRTSSSSDKPPSSLLKRKLSNGKLNLSHDSVSSEHLFERPEETDENSTDDLFEDKPTKRKKTETSSKVKSPAITKSNGKRKFDEGEVEENVVDDRDDGKTKPQRKRAKSNPDNLALNKSRSNGKVGKGEKKIIEDSEEEEELNDSVLFSQQKNKGSSKRKGRTSTK